jgi:hypothetical protein
MTYQAIAADTWLRLINKPTRVSEMAKNFMTARTVGLE